MVDSDKGRMKNIAQVHGVQEIQTFLVAPEESGKVFQWLKVWEKPMFGMGWDLNPYYLKPMVKDVSNGFSKVYGRHQKSSGR